ncbi:PQQ-dependent sugar dehydrogenase [Patescibacteria group bacterium]|jgi:glucose/arabinose dehydrogenase|nr:PQQ-dependent sugar dehydrogenase [Patescibacteria group bacterium]
MNFHRLKIHVIMPSILLAGILFGPMVSAQVASPLIEGSLVQAQGDSKVYYIQNAQKRWVTTEQAFLAQGFRWSDITIIEPQRLLGYLEGPEISSTVSLGLILDRSLLPDLAPVAPYDIRFAVENGRTKLRFTATFWNRGKGAFELNAGGSQGQTGDREFSATQRMFQPDGSFIDRPVGTLFWHEIHQHYHFDEFGSYKLEMVRPAAGAALAPVVTNKTTFCMRDDMVVAAPSEGARQAKKYTGCSSGKQGVSVGWADVYPYTLADQYFDVTGLPAGTYKLIFNVDPHGFFSEGRRDNNVSMTFVEINPATRELRVMGTASPYESPSNRFPNGTLVQAEGDSKVYVIYNNKKRWIRDEQVFRSYGFSWASIYVLPKRSVDVIPSETLVRVAGTSPVYALNVAGFKRRLLSPEIFTSYGLTGANVTDINQTEFDSIPFTDLIARIGDERVYSMSSKRKVGTFETLRPAGLDSDSVHGVNETDFQAYAVAQVADGLEIPWDIAFLPDGDMLVTERTGTVRRIGKQPASMPIPSVLTAGEGGLMGIALDPGFAENKFVYLYYTTSEGGRKNRVTRFRLEGNSLVQDRIILDNIPSATYHDGGQIDFGPDGKLYVVTGDAQQPDLAQDTNSLAGKTLRMNSDGSVPSDNPFGNLVWSYGHRNPQGLAWDLAGNLYEGEHGPTGEFGLCCRDEVNRIEKGGNYGWPIIKGDETRSGMYTPKLNSGASATWAPSGIAQAKGRLFFAGLRGSTLYQSVIQDDGSLMRPTSHLASQYGRLRGVVLGPDGYLYLTTSNRDGRGTPRPGDDKILRIHPDFLE